MFKLLNALALLLLSSQVMAGDHYVITHTLNTQKEAQEKAALDGGWVLNTNLYSDLKKDLFAVVRGRSRHKRWRKVNWIVFRKVGVIRVLTLRMQAIF